MSISEGVTVLYVEDEGLIRELVESTLQDFGFAVAVAADGATALAALEQPTAPVQVLVTDVNLGSLPDGWEVARRARELDRGLPVVYTTGAAGPEWRSKAVSNSLLVPKPFTTKQLVRAIVSLLEKSEAARVIC